MVKKDFLGLVLTEKQYLILKAIDKFKYINACLKECNCTQAHTHRICHLFVKYGILSNKPVENRIVYYDLTAKGKKILDLHLKLAMYMKEEL